MNQQDHSHEEKTIWRKNAERWPSDLVARSEVRAFSGGLLNPKSLANLDCLGLGPERVRVGAKVAYTLEGLVSWLEERTETIGKRADRAGGAQ